jgi:glutamyl-tRNA reductase
MNYSSTKEIEQECEQQQQGLEELVILGVTHNSAENMDQLSGLVMGEEEQRQLLPELKEVLDADELVYISTCNRVSFIIISDRSPQVLLKVLRNWFIATRGDGDIPVAESWIQLNGRRALDHLLLVASSLDSMVVGERQILGQFKQSFVNAREMDLSGSKLAFLHDQILKIAKQVYGNTSVSKGRLSVVSLAEEKIDQFCSGGGLTAVLVGAGKMIDKLAEYLKNRTSARLVFINRTVAKSRELAMKYGGETMELNAFIKNPNDFDILATSTAAPHHLFSRTFFLGLEEKSNRLLIDLAIPADVEPSVNKMAGITLVNMESLRRESKRHRANRDASIGDAEKIIEEGAETILDRWKIRSINPAIGALRRKYEQESMDHLNKLFETRLQNLEDEVKDTISDWARRMATHWAVAHAAGIKKTARDCCMKAVVSYLDGSGVERKH